MITRIIPTCWFSFSLLVLIDNFAIRFHGWAAARADLRNEENRKEYVSVSFVYASLKYDRFDDVYGRLTEYFKMNLS